MLLITGGAGYIGSHTVHYLINLGYNPNDIIVFDNLQYGHPENVPATVTLIRGDLTNRAEIEEVFSANAIDEVIHFAAYAYVGESMTNPYKYFSSNITGGLNLLEAMKDYGCKRIVFSSSCSVYGIPKKLPITEDEEINPINPYGETKAILEKILRWYDNIFGIKYVSLRYFNASGAGFDIGESHDPETHLIPLAMRTLFDSRYKLQVFGGDYHTRDGFCIRDYVHVLDLADAHFRALNYLRTGDQSIALNLGSEQGISVREIIGIIEQVSGKPVRFEVTERRMGDPQELVASSILAADCLGWKPQRDIYEIIKSAYQWHKSTYRG